jgi:GNAT superfamily N-acetyltransferase
MKIIRVQTSDIQLLAPLFDAYRQFYRQRSDLAGARRFLRERLRRGESVIFVVFVDKEPVGFVQLYPSFDSVALGRVWILYDLFVVPAARRSGVGRALLERAQKFARVPMILETARGNRVAQRLYEQLGWRRDREFYRYHWKV